MAKPLLVDADGPWPGIVHPAAQIGNRVFVDCGRYGGGMNNAYAKANYLARQLAADLDREIEKAAKRLRLR